MSRKKQSNTEETDSDELTAIEKARTHTFDWAIANQINILSLDLVTPSVLNEKKFSVWFFFDTDTRLTNYEANGTIEKLKTEYLSELTRLGCPAEYLEGVIFFCDTQENVERYAKMQPLVS